jgi:hypothetical protein
MAPKPTDLPPHPLGAPFLCSQYKVSRQLGELMLRLHRSVREAVVRVGALREALAVGTSPAAPTTASTTASWLPADVALTLAGSSAYTGAALSTSILLGQQESG